jgi:hypothetical protein
MATNIDVLHSASFSSLHQNIPVFLTTGILVMCNGIVLHAAARSAFVTNTVPYLGLYVYPIVLHAAARSAFVTNTVPYLGLYVYPIQFITFHFRQVSSS